MLFYKLMILHPVIFQIGQDIANYSNPICMGQKKGKKNAVAMFVINTQSVKKEEKVRGFRLVN